MALAVAMFTVCTLRARCGFVTQKKLKEKHILAATMRKCALG